MHSAAKSLPYPDFRAVLAAGGISLLVWLRGIRPVAAGYVMGPNANLGSCARGREIHNAPSFHTGSSERGSKK